MLSSVTSLGSAVKLRTIGLSSAFWLLLTNAIAIVLTLAVALSVGLGQGVQLELSEGSGDTLTGLIKPLDEVLLGLFPSNIAGDFVSNNITGIILFALLFAVAYLVANRTDDPNLRSFKSVIDGTKKVIMTAVGFIIELTPYAVLALVATTTATAVTRIETVLATAPTRSCSVVRAIRPPSRRRRRSTGSRSSTASTRSTRSTHSWTAPPSTSGPSSRESPVRPRAPSTRASSTGT
ncbi:cation:dicarboxylate symporter family transporter [Microbacterium oxydans]|uniref:cation:dicarboxylate symporter family transporter n=1 Tax=Microbacterium oxydans TaxID=82380 RepID=UPI003A5D1540